CLRPLRLAVLQVHAVIADQGIGHGDDLTLVRRVGQYLLVAGHASVEDDLAEGLAGRAESVTGEDRAVFEGEFGRPSRHVLSPRPVIRTEAGSEFRSTCPRFWRL